MPRHPENKEHQTAKQGQIEKSASSVHVSKDVAEAGLHAREPIRLFVGNQSRWLLRAKCPCPLNKGLPP